MKNIIIKFNLLVFIIIFYIYIFLYIIIPIYLNDNPKILYNTIFWICCVIEVSQMAFFLLRLLFWGSNFCGEEKLTISRPTNTVTNSVNTIG